ncbi:cobalamin biosynthesis protein CobQ [Roseobacter sp. HKCCA0434]|uniref:cobalamin biosynthesis protein CobQ n=1 Tax=Roseobacter sp. HKCCA0434 TaxID=3079297 RepID=UPI002905D5FE|nr:cobalamin biosynthesis protein CobQ [Roseobacter sp. HKCCA0434]
MNTPAHVILSAGIFARADRPRVTAAAIAGGLVPDLSLYLIGTWMIGVAGQSPETFFRETYYADWMQAVMAVDNSIPLWTLGVVLALALRARIAAVFALCGLLHVAADFLLHHDDARRQFWPLGDWVFVSPVSYWDPAHYGDIFGPVETGLCVVFLVLIWRRFSGWIARGLILVAAALQLAPVIIWGLMFS